jgi:hypothetical protein
VITLTNTQGHTASFYLHAASYADGGATCLTLSRESDPLGHGTRLTDNCFPESLSLISEHFHLSPALLGDRLLFPLLLTHRIIEPVPSGQTHHDGRPAYRLCAGVLPDTDQRRRRVPVQPIVGRSAAV